MKKYGLLLRRAYWAVVITSMALTNGYAATRVSSKLLCRDPFAQAILDDNVVEAGRILAGETTTKGEQVAFINREYRTRQNLLDGTYFSGNKRWFSSAQAGVATLEFLQSHGACFTPNHMLYALCPWWGGTSYEVYNKEEEEPSTFVRGWLAIIDWFIEHHPHLLRGSVIKPYEKCEENPLRYLFREARNKKVEQQRCYRAPTDSLLKWYGLSVNALYTHYIDMFAYVAERLFADDRHEGSEIIITELKVLRQAAREGDAVAELILNDLTERHPDLFRGEAMILASRRPITVADIEPLTKALHELQGVVAASAMARD